MTNNPATAQDYTQDIFIKVFQKLDTFQNSSSLATWLYAITHNYCLDQIRAKRRHRSCALDESLTDSLVEEADEKIDYTLMEQLIQTLPEADQYLLYTHYQQGIDQATLARQQWISLSAVKMRLFRSRRKLLEQYKKLL
ncbi:RNA polymerase sigma factor [Spirosoma litoris]